MLDRILEFSDLLRRNGLRVSVPENMDAASALELVGVGDRGAFKSALRAALVKQASDAKTFDDLFDVFFLGLGGKAREMDDELMRQLGMSPAEFQAMLDALAQFLENLDGEISALTRALLTGDMGEVERLLRAAAEAERGENPGMRVLMFAQGIGDRIGIEGVRAEIENLKALLGRGGAPPELIEKMAQYAEQRMRNLMQLVRELARRETDQKDPARSERERHDYLSQKSFVYYTEDDVRKMNEVVVRLARRFKNRLSLRRKHARRGRLDVSATFRKNLQYGGVPFRIKLDRRKKEKPEVVVLCDISDSVLNASRFMLQFVYSVQDLYSKVRSFVFVSDIGEVTKLFEEHEIHQAVEKALRGDVIDVYSHSNFGRAFELFYRHHWTAITPKTTVLVIGDGRNNYNRANDWVLKEIRGKAKQLVWLNPESRMTWGYGDSEMPRYAQHCSVVEECRNILQLYRLIDRIAA
ncbi:MAG TPA: VWA domain-containing protein [Candidatus Binatia bacterium]